MKKEEIYIDLRNKSKEELIKLQNILIMFNEKTFRKDFGIYLKHRTSFYLEFNGEEWVGNYRVNSNKIEVTIQQLKEILQPMEKFTPIAMKCTQEQFEAIESKLKATDTVERFGLYPYLVNNCDNRVNVVTNVCKKNKCNYDRKVYEEWNEEIFLKACCIEVDTLQQQLEKAEAEVKRLRDEINKINIGDWVFDYRTESFYKLKDDLCFDKLKKITDRDLIKKLNELIK